jgi:hypothetical protein
MWASGAKKSILEAGGAVLWPSVEMQSIQISRKSPTPTPGDRHRGDLGDKSQLLVRLLVRNLVPQMGNSWGKIETPQAWHTWRKANTNAQIQKEKRVRPPHAPQLSDRLTDSSTVESVARRIRGKTFLGWDIKCVSTASRNTFACRLPYGAVLQSYVQLAKYRSNMLISKPLRNQRSSKSRTPVDPCI